MTRTITTEVIRHGSFGPIVWDTATGQTRAATQDREARKASKGL